MKWIYAPLMSLAFFASPVLAYQDDPATAVTRGDQTLQVHRLKYASAEDIAVIVSRLIDPGWRMATEKRLNQLIVHADATAHAKISDLIKLVDVEVKKTPNNTRLNADMSVIIPVMNRRAEDLIGLLGVHVEPNQFRVDEATNSIMLSATPNKCDRVRNAVRAVDVAAPSISLHFMVLGPDGKALIASPEQEKLSRELNALGLHEYGLISRIAVNCLAGSRYAVSGKVSSGGSIVMEGNVLLGERDSKSAVIQVSGTVSCVSPTSGASSQAQLSSTLSVPLGDMMIIGMAPSSGDPDQPLILVVRARIAS